MDILQILTFLSMCIVVAAIVMSIIDPVQPLVEPPRPFLQTQ